jgi:hypothetical protein
MRGRLVLAALFVSCGGNAAVSPGTGSGDNSDAGAQDSGGAGGALDRCTSSAECILAACCIQDQVELGLFTPINASNRDAFMANCPADAGNCRYPDLGYEYLGARCSDGRCVGFDLGAMSVCTKDSDCHVRHGHECCEADCANKLNAFGLTSSAEGQLRKWMCDADSGTCAVCPQFGFMARCFNGHCAVAVP